MILGKTVFDRRSFKCPSKQNYCHDRKFSDRYTWANSADPDQTAPDGLQFGNLKRQFAIENAIFN